MVRPDPLEGYATDAAELIPAYEALSTTEVLAPVIDLLPSRACRALDVGAGTGRDAAWLVEQGHQVTAVEPVAAHVGVGRQSVEIGEIVDGVRAQVQTLRLEDHRRRQSTSVS